MDDKLEKENLAEELRKQVKLVLGVIILAAVMIIIFYFCVKRYKGLKESIDEVAAVFRPIVFGFAMAFLMSPIMTFFDTHIGNLIVPHVKNKDGAKRKIRLFSSILAILILVAAIVVFLSSVIPQMIQTISYIYNHLEEQLMNVLDWADHITGGRFTTQINQARNPEKVDHFLTISRDFISQYMNWGGQNEMLKQITSSVIDIGKYLAAFLIGLFVAVYFLIDKEKYKSIFKKMLYGLFPAKMANPIMDVMIKAKEIFYGFFVGKIIDSIIIGFICYGCMLLFGWPYPVLVSVIIGVTNIIPVFGPYIGAVPTVLIIFFTNPMSGIYFLIYILVLQQIDGNIIGPKILGDSTGVDSFWVLFAIVVGGGLFGFMGMLLGVPVVALLYYVLSKVFVYLARKRGLPVKTAVYEKVKFYNEETETFEYEEDEEKKGFNIKGLFERFSSKRK
ncbi:MAG: AI-2E family transporter [Lachnospiraceae bacterium]|nr:AI-2E family transporter [Lachnospiraceae bacterium]